MTNPAIRSGNTLRFIIFWETTNETKEEITVWSGWSEWGIYRYTGDRQHHPQTFQSLYNKTWWGKWYCCKWRKANMMEGSRLHKQNRNLFLCNIFNDNVHFSKVVDFQVHLIFSYYLKKCWWFITKSLRLCSMSDYKCLHYPISSTTNLITHCIPVSDICFSWVKFPYSSSDHPYSSIILISSLP